MNRLLLALLGLLTAVASVSSFSATIDYRSAPKFAVVVGNVRYEGKLQLRNAENDAKLIAGHLRKAGYNTELLLNADRGALYRSIGKLADNLKAGGVGAFYYAGHGTEIKGRNYLIPLNASLTDASALPQTALPVDYLIQRLKDSGAHLSLVFLDACRDDPAESAFGSRYRGAGVSGFSPEKPANGMLIAYATQPGERALDGRGSNSPFALALGDWLLRPGLPIEDAMKHVMTDVRASTRDEQRPWIATSLIGNFALVPAKDAHPTLAKAVAGKNVDGTPARSTSTDASSTAIQWFQNPAQNEQMLLTTQITREAAKLNKDDLPRLEQQAKGGSVIAASVLGVAYRQGFGIGTQATRSNKQAFKWLSMAATQNMPFALNELGEMYFLGHGVTRDNRHARRYFEAAAHQGYTPAKLNLFQLDAESGYLDASSINRILGLPAK